MSRFPLVAEPGPELELVAAEPTPERAEVLTRVSPGVYAYRPLPPIQLGGELRSEPAGYRPGWTQQDLGEVEAAWIERQQQRRLLRRGKARIERLREQFRTSVATRLAAAQDELTAVERGGGWEGVAFAAPYEVRAAAIDLEIYNALQ